MIRAVQLRGIDLNPGLQYKLRFAALDDLKDSPAALARASTQCQSVLLTRSCPVQAGQESFDFPEAGWLILNSSKFAVELLCAPQAPKGGQGDEGSASEAHSDFEKVSARFITLNSVDSGCADVMSVTFDDAPHFCAVLVKVQAASQKEAAGCNVVCNEALGDIPSQPIQWPSSVLDGLVVREIPTKDGSVTKPQHTMQDFPSRTTSFRLRPLLHEKVAPTSEKHEVALHEIDTLRAAGAQDKSDGKHVVVLVPGYQMRASDLRTLRNYFCLVLQTARFFIPSANVCDCDDLHRAGVRLAQEVADCIKECCTQGTELSRLSFVAVTTGGLKVRAALPWLNEYADQMFALITLCTPHLGLLPKSLSLLHRFLFLAVRTVAPCELCEALALQDGRRPHDSIMYKLSRDNGIRNFRRIIFMSSERDWQFPAFSCRAEYIPPEDKGHALPHASCFGKRSSRRVFFAILGLFCAMLAFSEVFDFQLVSFAFGWPTLTEPRHQRMWARLFRFGMLGSILVGYRLRNYLSIGPWTPQMCLDPNADNCSAVMTRNLLEKIGNTQLLQVDIEFALRWQYWLRWRPLHTHLLQNKNFLRTLSHAYGVLLQ